MLAAARHYIASREVANAVAVVVDLPVALCLGKSSLQSGGPLALCMFKEPQLVLFA